MLRPSSALIAHIYKMAGVCQEDHASDSELLKRYANVQDENAFSALMMRHAGMVWNICRRILGKTEDVEEAFQTTFLALACKANKIHVDETLVGWLQQVAHRTAVTARRKAKSRQKLQDGLDDLTRSKTSSEIKANEAYEELYGEIARLPEKQRVAVVLHYLEGKTQAEIAVVLGVTESSVWDRLKRGKATLQKRLSQHGMVGGIVMMGALLETMAAPAAIPQQLLQKTVKTATAFRNGAWSGSLAEFARQVLKHTPPTSPWWMKGWLIALLCVGGLGLAAGGVAWKNGIFGTRAEGPLVAKKQENMHRSTKGDSAQPRLDVYGDPLPPRALARMGTIRFRHGLNGAIGLPPFAMGFTLDGKTLMTAGPHNPPRLWDASAGKLLRQFDDFPPDSVIGACLSPDGSCLLCRGGKNGELRLWETSSGKLLHLFPENLKSPRFIFFNGSFSPDGKTIAAEVEACVGLWETNTGRRLWERTAEAIEVIAFSPTGRTIALGSRAEGVILCSARTGKVEKRLGPKTKIVSLSFSPRGDALLVGCQGTQNKVAPEPRSLHLFDVGSDKERWRIDEQPWKTGVGCATLSPHGDMMAACGYGYVSLYDASSGKPLRQFPGSKSINGLAFSPSGRTLAVLDGAVVHFWDVLSGKPLLPLPDEMHDGCILSAGFLADGATFASGGMDQSVRLWDMRTGKHQQLWAKKEGDRNIFLRKQYCGNQVAVSPDGKMLAAAFRQTPPDLTIFTGAKENQETVAKEYRTEIYLWDAACGRQLQHWSLQGVQMDPRDRLVFSPNGKLVAVNVSAVNVNREAGGTTTVLDVTTGKPLDHTFSGVCPLFSPDGTRLITAEGHPWCKTLVFWDVVTGKKLHSIVREEQIRYMTLTADGETLAVNDGDAASYKILLYPLDWASPGIYVGSPRRIPDPCSLGAGVSKFSPDGRLLALAGGEDKTVHLWELASSKERARFRGHLDRVSSLCFSADGRRLLSGSNDTTLLTWDVTGRLQDDGRLRSARPSEEELNLLWQRLAASDAVQAGEAVWNLTAAGPQAVALLNRCLKPVHAKSMSESTAKLIAAMDSDSFQKRKEARDALAKLGESTEPLLRRALLQRPSLELRTNLQELLADIETKKVPRESLRELRAVEVLEKIGDPDSRRLLQKLATGTSGYSLTRAAQASLNRLPSLGNTSNNR